MLIRLESRLEFIRANYRDGLPVRKNGTLAVIDGDLDFGKTDGYIQFMKIALGYIPSAWGTQVPKWRGYLDRIYGMAEKLQDNNVRFKGTTKDEWVKHCEELSHLMEKPAAKHLPVVSLDVKTSDDLVPFMEKHVAKADYPVKGFLYDEDGPHELLERMEASITGEGDLAAKNIANDIMLALNDLKFKKGTRMTDLSICLCHPGYHEHVADALNVLMETAVYAMNCSSTKQNEAFSFDTQKVHNQLRYVEYIMERIKQLT